MIFNSQVICNVYPIICRMQIMSVFFYYYSFDLHTCIWIDNPIQFLTGTQNSCSNPIFSNFFVLCIQNLAVTRQTLSICTWICSQTSCHVYFLVQISSLIFFTKMFCLKHQHFIIYSIQIFIFFSFMYCFLIHLWPMLFQILIFQTSVQNYSIIATAFKILGNWKLWTFCYMKETWTCINILFT